MTTSLSHFIFLFIFLIAPAPHLLAQHYNHDNNYKKDLSLLNPNQRKISSYLDIEKVQLELRHRTPSTTAWKDFARLYEEYVTLFCYQTSDYELIVKGSKNLSNSCIFYLDKLATYSEGNPLVTCAKTGFESEKCLASYRQQYITRNDNKISKVMGDFEEELAKRKLGNKEFNHDQSEGIYKTLKAKLAQSDGKNVTDWFALAESISDSTIVSCGAEHIRYIDTRPPDFMIAANLLDHDKRSSDKLFMEVYELLHDPERIGNSLSSLELNKNDTEQYIHDADPFEVDYHKTLQSFRPNKFWRVKAISHDCFKWILRGLEFDSNFPPSICNLHGNGSPFCHYAKKTHKTPKTGEVKKKKTYKMESF